MTSYHFTELSIGMRAAPHISMGGSTRPAWEPGRKMAHIYDLRGLEINCWLWPLLLSLSFSKTFLASLLYVWIYRVSLWSFAK